MTEMEYICMWLSLAEIYAVKTKRIEEYLGDLRELNRVDIKSLSNRGIITPVDADNMIREKNYEKIEKEFMLLEKYGARMVTCDREEYPANLNNIYDKPYALYVKGDMPKNNVPCVAIVGARECSEYGREMAYSIAKKLSDSGVEVISGMARGIDIAAHKGAYYGAGNTYAVLGCGVDVCYPRENIDMYVKIPDKGGIISEFRLKTKPVAMRFPMRNRIISGISDAVIVVEAREKSGSLITVDQALEQGKEVFVVPGRLTDKLSVGCNNLIKQGAQLITDVQDVLSYLEKMYEFDYVKGTPKKLTLATDEKIVYSCLDLYPKSLGELMSELDMEVHDIMDILMRLIMKDVIRESSRNYYVLKVE